MATPPTTTADTKDARATKPSQTSARTLLERYECGPVPFSGEPGSLYERHLVFDHVIGLGQADARQRFEAVAGPAMTRGATTKCMTQLCFSRRP